MHRSATPCPRAHLRHLSPGDLFPSARRRRQALATVAVLAGALLAPDLTRADEIDDYLAREMAARKIPGLAFAIARDGAVVREGSFGLSHVETGSPVTAASVFAIASLDKQVTAAGLLKAAELGKLGVDDPVSRWLDVELPGATLRQLVSHLSGLPDDTVATVEGRYFTDYTTEQLLAYSRDLVPLAPPGTRFHYSDTGLFFAQLATEKATGEPWWDFLRRELFAPAGVTTAVSMAPGLLLPNRVTAFTLDDEGKLVRDRRLDVDYGPLYCDLAMTVADFTRFVASQDRDRPLSAASVAALTTPTRLKSGAPATELFQWSRYGLGVGLDTILGEEATLHSGHSGVGFVRFPKRKLTVVVFTNLEHPAGSDPVGLAIGVAGLLEPTLSLAKLSARQTADAETVARFRREYESFLSGDIDLARYSDAMQLPAWEASSGLVGRARRWGALTAFELLREEPVDGERSLLFRARHVNATAYFRVSLDSADRISRVVWWHL